MKKKLIRLFIAVGLVLGGGSCADVTDTPEYYGVYKEANIENIRPSSWLREILQRQRDGLGLNRKESGYPYNTCLWNGIIPEGGNPIAKGWWPYEQSGYMIDGLYRCGIFLRDSVLMQLGSDNVGYVLSHPRANGMLGPETLGENQWAFSVFARTLLAYYDYTEDDRIPVLLKKHFSALNDTLTNRQTCIIESMCKMYSYTGDKEILQKAGHIWDLFSMNGGTKDNEVFIHGDMVSSKPIDVHGVTAAEVSKQPLILYLYTGRQEYLDAALGFYSSVERENELPDGIPASYESLFPKHAEALHETCDISDFIWSYGYMLMATGDVKWADKMESAVYNAALGAINKDFKALQYFSSPNQLLATEKIGGLMTVGYLLRRSHTLHLQRIKLSRKSMQLTARNIGYMVKLGSSAFVTELSIAFMMFLGNYVFISHLGEDGVAAFSIACYFFPIIFMIYDAIVLSGQPILSYNFGLRDTSRIKQTLRLMYRTALLCGISFFTLTALFRHQIVALFIGPEYAAYQIAVKGLPYFAFGFIFFAVNMIGIGYYQSIERAHRATVITLLRGILFMLVGFLVLPILLDVKGIWLAVPLAEVLTLLLIGSLYLHEKQKQKS